MFIIFIVLIAVGLLVWGVTATNAEAAWQPVQITLAGVWTVLYNAEVPDLTIVAISLGAALLFVVIVVATERIVANRYRRTPLEVADRTLAPKRIMAQTRGVFTGEVTVTVLIPAHNEEASLPDTLASLRDQTVAPQRVLVIADNCTDRTAEVARRFGAEVFETVGNTHKKGGALNQALSDLLPGMGDNDAVLVMDADTQLSEGFIATAVERFTWDRALMAVGGLFQGEEGHGILGQFQRNEYFRYQREISRRDGRVFVLTGTGTAFRATALRAVAEARGSSLPGIRGDVYDTFALTEDNELTIAIKSLGGLMVSPQQCAVTTELMPTWRMLWAQRLRWQRGALENLGAYGVTPQTFRYWSQQVAIGYGVFALFAYFALMFLMLTAMDTWVWFPFWLGVGLLFAVERTVTAWRGGWRARVLAALVIPELVYDCFLNLAFLKGVIEISAGRRPTWKHVQHTAAESPTGEPGAGGATQQFERGDTAATRQGVQ
ncbi:glycosyltransferase family 2 protein [Leucobacter tenebrionis]|uniref:glycosyltransferase family 2 protein n=1 Tax=Leucobacter tenebrionis TaxID=2873270 RepID=UPI001CA6D1A1|nr:glycosyltransferase family 2 protein [Leucobacter tenebrionis]QZY51749.1 glycosyltransferase family 2 protein [Leucobacter tenebrionis]